jgi:hypothetical protein
MFESVTIRRGADGMPITAGKLAEALLFYGRIHVFLDHGSILNLVRQVGVRGMLRLLRHKDVSATHSEELLGVISLPGAGLTAYDYGSMVIVGHQDLGEFHKPSERLVASLIQVGIPEADATRFAVEFFQLVPSRPFTSIKIANESFLDLARKDLDDEAFVKHAVRAWLQRTAGAEPETEGAEFRVFRSELGLFPWHNLDFASINDRRGRKSPRLDPIGESHVLVALLDAFSDLVIAAEYGGDFITSDAVAAVIDCRQAFVLRKTERSREQRLQFADVVLDGAPDLAESIDSGDRSFDEFLDVLDRANAFKRWVVGRHPDANLAAEYLKELTRETWLQSMKGKALRYVVCAFAEFADEIVGKSVGAADAFLIDRLIGGWRPNYFVERRLRPFLAKGSTVT